MNSEWSLGVEANRCRLCLLFLHWRCSY